MIKIEEKVQALATRLKALEAKNRALAAENAQLRATIDNQAALMSELKEQYAQEQKAQEEKERNHLTRTEIRQLISDIDKCLSGLQNY